MSNTMASRSWFSRRKGPFMATPPCVGTGQLEAALNEQDRTGELDVERLTSKIVGHAVELLRAERGYVLLSQLDGSLSVHAARGVPDAASAEFSRSIAEGVIATREPVVTLDNVLFVQDNNNASGSSANHPVYKVDLNARLK